MKMDYNINAMYFSPTGTTEKTVTEIAGGISDKSITKIDFTLPAARNQEISFSEKDIVVFGVPVYAGRVPNILLKFLNSISGSGALAVAVVSYGNRNYDDALIELKDILESVGFNVIAAASFIGEHSFSKTLGKNRPDSEDIIKAEKFGRNIFAKISENRLSDFLKVKGNKPYRPYYMPKNRQGESVNIRKVTPKTDENCIDCKICADVCPMGSIDYDDVSVLKGICIKCGACIKKCPVGAKYYDDEDYLRHKKELEVDFASRREPEMFI